MAAGRQRAPRHGHRGARARPAMTRTVELGVVSRRRRAGRERVGLVYFDMHPDPNTPEMVVTWMLYGMGVAHTPAVLAGTVPAIAGPGPWTACCSRPPTWCCSPPTPGHRRSRRAAGGDPGARYLLHHPDGGGRHRLPRAAAAGALGPARPHWNTSSCTSTSTPSTSSTCRCPTTRSEHRHAVRGRGAALEGARRRPTCVLPR